MHLNRTTQVCTTLQEWPPGKKKSARGDCKRKEGINLVRTSESKVTKRSGNPGDCREKKKRLYLTRVRQVPNKGGKKRGAGTQRQQTEALLDHHANDTGLPFARKKRTQKVKNERRGLASCMKVKKERKEKKKVKKASIVENLCV